MNELQIFNNPEFGEIRTVDAEGKTMFVATDVAKALGYSRPADAITAHCKGSVKWRVLTPGGEQDVKVIPEGDIYRLVIRSKLPSAEKFEKWVFDEVLPSIRQNGGYISGQEELSDQELMAKALMVAQRTIERREQEIKSLESEIEGKTKVIEELTPKATYYDIILECPDLLTTTEIAKDYGMSAAAFNNILHDFGIQYKQSQRWFLYTKYEGYGYAQSKTKQFKRSDGSIGTKTHMYWTQKGRLFLYGFLKQREILPMMERGI